MSALTAGSLFSGIGGIDVAFAAAGFDIRFQVEIDPFCRKVLAKHAPRYWPNAAQHVDIRDVGRAELGYVDVLFGGVPCQDISYAGAGAGLNGARSGLWYEFRRIIGDIRPRVVFLENVPAILTRGGSTVVAHLTGMGYDARWGTMAALDTGAVHQRNRWWLVAYATGARWDRRSYFARGSGEAGEFNHSSAASIPQGRGISQSRLVRDANGLSSWMDCPRWPAPRGARQYTFEPPRTVSVRTKEVDARNKALGNAVVPQVVYPFAVEIARMLFADAESEAS